jgi:hypothetical protein
VSCLVEWEKAFDGYLTHLGVTQEKFAEFVLERFKKKIINAPQTAIPDLSMNRDIANEFRKIADLLEKHGENKFRVNGYRNGASAVEALTISVKAMNLKEVGAINNIGDSLSKKINEFIETGQMLYPVLSE